MYLKTLIIIRTGDAVLFLRSVCVPIERLVRAGKWSKRERAKQRWGRGIESVVAEEASPGLDVREKVYTTHNDGPSGLFPSHSHWLLLVAGSCEPAFVPIQLNHHSAPRVVSSSKTSDTSLTLFVWWLQIVTDAPPIARELRIFTKKKCLFGAMI